MSLQTPALRSSAASPVALSVSLRERVRLRAVLSACLAAVLNAGRRPDGSCGASRPASRLCSARAGGMSRRRHSDENDGECPRPAAEDASSGAELGLIGLWVCGKGLEARPPVRIPGALEGRVCTARLSLGGFGQRCQLPAPWGKEAWQVPEQILGL